VVFVSDYETSIENQSSDYSVRPGLSEVEALKETLELYDKLPIKGLKAFEGIDLESLTEENLAAFENDFGLGDIVDTSLDPYLSEDRETIAEEFKKYEFDPGLKERLSYKVRGLKDWLANRKESYHLWTDNLEDADIAFGAGAGGITLAAGGGLMAATMRVPPDYAVPIVGLLAGLGAAGGAIGAVAENKDNNKKIKYEQECRPFLEKIDVLPSKKK
jgi:hypothetical protein